MDIKYILRLLTSLSLPLVCLSTFARLRLDGGDFMWSSTLRWVPGGGRLPNHAVPVTEDDPSVVWCRARRHGAHAGGSLSEGVCRAPFLGKSLAVSKDYDVLVSINGSARVTRVQWDSYRAPPPLAVAASGSQKELLAFYPPFQDSLHLNTEGENLDAGVLQFGVLVPQERRAHLMSVEEGEEGIVSVEEAWVLREDEPIEYHLRGVQLEEGKRLKVMEKEHLLREFVLENPDLTPLQETSLQTITASRTLYWGQIRGTVLGLPATVTTEEGEEWRDLVWGTQNEFKRVIPLTVSVLLQEGTGIPAQVVGVVRKTEAPYTATLTSIYADGARQSRVVTGLHLEQNLVFISAQFSSPFFLHNSSSLSMASTQQPLYSSTTTTTTTTTTTSSTTTTTPSSLSHNPKSPVSDSLSSADGVSTPVRSEGSYLPHTGAAKRTPFDSRTFVLSVILLRLLNNAVY